MKGGDIEVNIGNFIQLNILSSNGQLRKEHKEQSHNLDFSNIMSGFLCETSSRSSIEAKDNKFDIDFAHLFEDIPEDIHELIVSILGLVHEHMDLDGQINGKLESEFLRETIAKIVTQLNELFEPNITKPNLLGHQSLNVNLNDLQSIYLSSNSTKSLLTQQDHVVVFKQKMNQLINLIGSKFDIENSNVEYDERVILKNAFSRSMNQPLEDEKKAEIDYVKPLQQNMLLDGNNHLTKAQHLYLHLGEKLEQPNPEQFIRQFQSILGKSSFVQLTKGLNELSIKLFPQHLGRLDVKLTQIDGKLFAQLRTTTAAAKESIESQIHLLKQAFAAQNIQVDKIEIAQHQQEHFADAQKDGQNNQQKEPEHQASREEDKDLELSTFSDMLEESFNTQI